MVRSACCGPFFAASRLEVVPRYTQRYLPGEQMYIAECAPREKADIVVDMNEWARPVIVKDCG